MYVKISHGSIFKLQTIAFVLVENKNYVSILFGFHCDLQDDGISWHYVFFGTFFWGLFVVNC
jgi:hypothetical protein